MSVEINYTKDADLGLWRGDMTVTLPPITVTRYKADKDDFRYEFSRAVTEIVEEHINREVERYDED
jgi:hypothetical protein